MATSKIIPTTIDDLFWGMSALDSQIRLRIVNAENYISAYQSNRLGHSDAHRSILKHAHDTLMPAYTRMAQAYDNRMGTYHLEDALSLSERLNEVLRRMRGL